MNIILTGGTGYIGSHTAVVLCEPGYKAVLFVKLSKSSVKFLTVFTLSRV